MSDNNPLTVAAKSHVLQKFWRDFDGKPSEFIPSVIEQQAEILTRELYAEIFAKGLKTLGIEQITKKCQALKLVPALEELLIQQVCFNVVMAAENFQSLPLVEPGYVLPQSLQDALRQTIMHRAAVTSAVGVHTLVAGVYWIMGGVAEHTDGNITQPITTGLIIINDCQARLICEDKTFALPVGAVYQLDSNKPHGTIVDPIHNNRLFAFLAWDCQPQDVKPIKAWAMEACDTLSYIAGQLSERKLNL